MVLELARRPRPRSSSGPELCTRGASSLTSSSPVHVEELDGEDAHVVELVEELPDVAAPRWLGAARSRPARARSCGAGCRRRGGSRPAASTRSHRRARGPRAPRARGRTGRATRGSSGTSAELATTRRSTSPRFVQDGLALAVVAAAPRLEHRRAGRAPARRARGRRGRRPPRTRRCPIPRRRNSSFSASRSCATSSATGRRQTRRAGRGDETCPVRRHALPLVGDHARRLRRRARGRSRRRAPRRRAGRARRPSHPG